MRSTTSYYLFVFLFRFGIGAVGALYAPFLVDIGLTYSQVSMVNAVYWICTLLFEVPTGMLADGRGRGWSVMAGALFHAVGSFWYFQADGFWHAVTAEAVAAVGAAFLSGALASWIVDAPDRTEPLPRVFGTATVLTGVATVLGTLLGVALAGPYGRGVAFAIDACASFGAFLLAFFLMRGKDPEHPLSEFEAVRRSLAHLRSSRPMRWAALAQGSYGIFQTFNMFWAPLLLTRLTQVHVGYAWIGMYLAVAASGFVVRTRLGSRDGTGSGMTAALALAAAPLVGFLLLPPLAAWFVLLAVHEFGRGAFAPFADAYVHERVESGYRATFSSLTALAQELGMALTLVAMAVVMGPFDNDPRAILWLWAVAGVASLAATALLWARRPT